LIVRILKGHVQPGQVSTFREQARQAVDDARGRDGIVYAGVARQACIDGAEEVIFVSVWRDLEALYRWVGGVDLLETPMLNNGNTRIFEQFGVEHYEAYEPLDPASAAAGAYVETPCPPVAVDAP
jgi:heme-degrading monooxygenase HmoA